VAVVDPTKEINCASVTLVVGILEAYKTLQRKPASMKRDSKAAACMCYIACLEEGTVPSESVV
jgi:hypothetical protein